MSTYGESRVCALGTVAGNTVTGEALEDFPVDEIQLEPRFQGTTPQNWDNNGYLKVGRASAKYDSSEGNISTSIRYRTAVLDLDGFHRYNAGTQSPPTICQN
jgi:hypothetical protein